MTDIQHVMGTDLALGSSGDLALVSDDEAIRERVLRRLLTNQGAYIWQLSYGGGLSSFVGQVSNTALLLATVRGQLLLESAVARQPLPGVVVSTVDVATTVANITYTSASTGSPLVSGVTLGAG
jgi:phage baseplate assembly protein W